MDLTDYNQHLRDIYVKDKANRPPVHEISVSPIDGNTFASYRHERRYSESRWYRAYVTYQARKFGWKQQIRKKIKQAWKDSRLWLAIKIGGGCFD